MIRGILQFALLIALCCALHRYGNQDIHGFERKKLIGEKLELIAEAKYDC